MPTNHSYLLKTRQRLIVAAIAACFANAPAWSNPSGPQVVNGSASFNQSGNLLTVTNSSGAIINWNSFSIGASETTRFNQASTSSSVLNRVLASDPSVLLGTLSSNGRVWLVNPAGIMVGQGARIDVAGFVASTLNVRNEDFLAGRLHFLATPNAGKLENSGQITTPSGGSVYLIAPAVSNNGIINAPDGEVLLAAGEKVNLIDTGTPGVRVEISGAEGSATNLGQIVAEAGRIGMAGVLVKNSGLLNASSVVREGGRVFLRASQEATAGGSISANSETGSGGRIEVAGAAVSVPAGAVLDASGDTKGGTILVGGGYQGKDASIANASSTSIESSASLKANATGSGDGGLIVAWSDDRTGAHGSFSARGGEQGGRGGLVETSGKRSLDVAGARVDTRAADGSAGTWLLDPADITVVNAGATGSAVYAPTGASSTIADADISTALATTGVSITTSSGSGGSGNITVNGYADTGGSVYISTSGSGARTLTLNADGKIDIHGGASISGTSGAPLTLNLYAGGDITHAGSIYTYGSAYFLSKGAITFGDTGGYSGYLSSSYGSPVTLIANWDGSSTAPNVSDSGQCAGSTFCGISGSGSIASNYGISGSGSLVDAGAVTLKAPGNIDLSSITINASGGNYSSSIPAGIGGAGGAVSIASTQGNLTTGYIYASGSQGGYGAGATSSAVNGGTGGTGGPGGTVSLSAAGTLTLDGGIYVSGGYGGSGGAGYYDYSLLPSAYASAGGKGGAGGNAGMINMSGASLTLSGATLEANGGGGGTGGSGSTVGSAGATGSASAVTLSTAGDIVLTGSNYVTANQVDLFAGKSISFGTAGASSTSGYLYSYSSPITLVANWNGSTTAPDIASSGQCADFAFCGISGSGSIDSSYYYYYSSLTNAGAVTVKAPGDIDLSNISINAYGRYGSDYGSAGGTGGAVSIASTKGNLTTGSISASGGGGSSGTYGSSSVVNGGTGGAGGVGGTVNLSAAGTLTVDGNINVEGGYGGSGGSGYYFWDSGTSSYVYSGTGGNGGAGGNAGTINASGATLILSGATLNANGGSGGSGGQGTTVGSSGGGGTGGNVTLTAIAGDLTTGYISASGGDGAGGYSGVSSGVTGGTGGTGGAGGAISLNAAGALTIGGSTYVTGGSGGYGGSGYQTYDTNTSAYVYNGTGGNGGAGGNAGTLSTSGASLLLSGTTLDANGGSGGSGGLGTSAGSAGAGGSASPILLSTAGDIVLTGGNYVTANQLDLFAGKSIAFGTTGTSTTSGYLYSYSSPVTLLANWNGSTTAPDIAASGQCAGSTFCGISGSGSIDSSYYYYSSLANAGAVTLKAPGDIDLSNIDVYARGRYGSAYGSTGGAGGVVSIASTKGNLTAGYVDAGGGGGGSGSYGNSSAVNGGTGGAGGAGGAISLSAAGTLTVDGSINNNGGYGGYGGSGHYVWDANTSSYVYSGTGGNGGAGGNAGTISMSGASLILSGATLNAAGGSGGSDGQGTAVGSAGGGGSGGNIILAATTGDLRTGYGINASGGAGADGRSGSSNTIDGNAGGTGGAGGTVSLSAAGTLALGGSTRVAGGSGGYGGSAYYAYDTNTSSYVYSGTGGSGGAGGNAGTITLSGASITMDNAHLDALGGFGGISGYDGAATRVRGGAGTNSALQIATPGDIRVIGSNTLAGSKALLLAGKAISLGSPGDAVTSASNGDLNSNTLETVLMANWNGSSSTPDVAATVQCGTLFCGINGIGSITNGYGYYEGYYYGGQSQNLHAGALTLTAAGPIDLKSINVSSIGGNGGNYYDYYYMGTREAGNGGAITISSTQGDVTLGNVSAVGGYGRYGISGTATDPNGGAAGAGGAGGSIHANAAGSLIVSEYIDASGGGGGQGGYGYYDSSLAAYTGAGGAGGNGGNGGTIALSGASITLDNANLRVLGGYAGSGSSGGTTTGAQGAFGAANSLQLGTTGNITVLGYNNLAASKVALLAGKTITLGDGANATSGDINSIASDILLVANWNGSASTPEVAATAQCGGAYCGIGGTGSVSNGYDYYGGYYYTGQLLSQNGGAITLKAAGPIDLTSISVHSIGGDGGNYYYLGTQEAGNGGVVTVSSSQSDVTLGNVSVAGGYGRYGTSGTVASPNGGAGGAGGAGGSVQASAAGSVTLSGYVDVYGGHGGYGGAGYYDSSLATPAYTGAGGAGGAGGNAGTVSVSGASLNLSGVAVYASGGSGGTGASGGTTAGSMGASGAASPVTLSASGDITLTGNNYFDSAQVKLLAGKNISFNSSADLSTNASGDALVLAAAGNFINNAGASALDAPYGRWLVYSTDPTLDTRGGLDYNFKQYGMSYSGTAYAGPGTGNGFIYSVAPTVTSSLTGATSKVYDGTTAASLTADNYATTGVLDNDIVVMDQPTTGTYADKNVGAGKSVSATVALVGASDGTGTVYGYQLASTTASGNIGQIGQRELSTWQGSTGGLWSNPANWDALPEGANVLAVSIPAGGSYQVTYDATAGNTSLQTLTSAQTLALSGGNLTVNSSLDTAGYAQSGGALSGSGNLTVRNSFSQTGGSIALTGTGSATITQATGDLIIHNLTAQNVSLAAQNGRIGQTGPIVTSALVTASVTGTALTDAGNHIGSFGATNTGSGNVELTSQGTIGIAGAPNVAGVADVPVIDNRGGSITLIADNVTATNAKVLASGDLIAQVAGDLKLNEGSSFTADRDIALTLKGASSTLYLNEVSGPRPSYLWAKAPSTIHIDYTTRTSGGLVIEGATADVLSYKSVVDASGFFYGPTKLAASPGTGLDVSGIASPVMPEPVVTAIEAVSNTITNSTIAATAAATTATTESAPKVEAPPPSASVTATVGSSPLLLSNTTQTTGGTEGTFGGSPTASSAPASSGDSTAPSVQSDKPAADKPAEDKSAAAKTDDKKEDEKKDDKKKEEAPAKKEDKPAPKKLATCS